MKWTTKTSMTLVLAFVYTACLSPVNICSAVTPQSTVKTAKANLSAISSMNIVGDGDTAALVVKLSSPSTYTSYKTTAPLRLVLDLSQASQGEFTNPLVLNKGNFKTITTSRFDTDAGVLTRIYVELVKDAEAEITASKNNPGELRISFPALSKPAIVAAKPEKVSSVTTVNSSASKVESKAVSSPESSIPAKT